MFANESNLADSCWHHVEVRRKRARLTVIIDKEKYGKIRQESSPTHIKLNLNNKTSNVIYYGGGPSEKLWFAQAKPLSFTGFLKQFYFEEINVIENALIRQSKGFKISDPLGVGIAEKNNSLLQSAEYNCRPELVGSGCFSDDETDLSCIPSTTTPTKCNILEMILFVSFLCNVCYLFARGMEASSQQFSPIILGLKQSSPLHRNP